MAVTTYTLTGDFGDLIGANVDPQKIRAWVKTNLPRGSAPVDTSTGDVYLGDLEITVASDGTFTVTSLPATNSADLNVTNGTLRYKVTAEHVINDRPGYWDSGWFELTANVHLGQVAGSEYVDPTFASQTMAEMEAIRDSQVAISGISTTDDAVEALVLNTAGAGPKTSAALDVVMAANASMPLLPAAAMGVIEGAATLGKIGSAGHLSAAAWDMPGDSYSVIGGYVLVPDSWTTFHIDLWWSQKEAAPSGNPLVGVIYQGLVDGQSLDVVSPSANAGGGLSVPGQYVVKRARMTLSPASLPSPGLVSLRVSRDGGGDSLNTAISILAVQIVPA